MTIANVSGQKGAVTSAGGTSVSRAFGSNVATNSLVVGYLWGYFGGGTSSLAASNFSKLSGSAVITDIRIHSNQPGSALSLGCYSWSALVTTGGSLTLQCTGLSSGQWFPTLVTDEFTGSFDTTRSIAPVSAQGATGLPSSGNITVPAGGALLLGVLSLDRSDSVTIAEAAGWTPSYEYGNGTLDNVGGGYYKIAAAGTDAFSITTPAPPPDYSWIASVAGIKEAAGGGSSIAAISRNYAQMIGRNNY
jgi:hypothetical protein